LAYFGAMEEAAAVRRATTEAVGDVVPEALRSDIESRLADGSMTPGALTLLAATAAPDGPAEFGALDGLVERAAGVQLIYEGLRLTRDLVRDDPWAAGDGDRGDMCVLAADVLVARGFYLLARTEAATRAVAVVRAFGRDQTTRREEDDPSHDRNLERDVLDLALVAGTAAASGVASPDRDWLVDRLLPADGFQPAETALDGVEADLTRLATADGGQPVEGSGD
jgi:hypothetical protein